MVRTATLSSTGYYSLCSLYPKYSHSLTAWIACVRSLSIELKGQELLNLPLRTWKFKLLNTCAMVYPCYSGW